MRPSPAWFTTRPLDSYPDPEQDGGDGAVDDDDTSMFFGRQSACQIACHRLLWADRRRRVALLLLIGAALVAFLCGRTLYDAASGLRHVPPGLWSNNGVLTVGKSPFHLKGISWYGMEHELHCLEGLDRNSLSNILGTLVSHDFNALRIPLALDNFNRDRLLGSNAISTFANPDLTSVTYRQLLRLVVERAAEHNILVLLDLHRLDSRTWPSDGKWYNKDTSMNDVIVFWEKLATDFRDQWNVIGADVINEPHGAESWHAWREFAERAGNRILSVAPRWLVFVEGVGNLPDAPQRAPVFWAENLAPSVADPPALRDPRKLVLSPHVYGTFSLCRCRPRSFPSLRTLTPY
jgi:endoglucanase